MQTLENLNTKIDELEASAILYGQENQGSLEGTCTVDNEEYKFCKLVTVKELIDDDYYTTSEENRNNKKDSRQRPMIVRNSGFN